MMHQGIYSGSSARALLCEGIVHAMGLAQKRIGPAGTKNAANLSEEIEQLSYTPYQRPGVQFAKDFALEVEKKCLGGSSRALILLGSLFKESAKRKHVSTLSENLQTILLMARNRVLESSYHLDSSEKLLQFVQKRIALQQIPPSSVEPLLQHIKSSHPFFVHIDSISHVTDPIFHQEPALRIPYFKKQIARPYCIEAPSLLIARNPIHSIHQITQILKEHIEPNKRLCILAPKVDEEVLCPLALCDQNLKSRIYAMGLPALWNASQVDQLCRFCSAKDLPIKNLNAQLGEASALHLDYEGENILVNHSCPIPPFDDCTIAGTLELPSSEKNSSLEKALQQARMAARSGVCWGGALTYARAAKTLEIEKKSIDSSLKEALQIAIQALKAPHSALISNRGYRGKTVTENLLESSSPWEGFDIEAEELCSFQERFILDPTDQILHILTLTSKALKDLLETETVILR